jgi:hypothetical protein
MEQRLADASTIDFELWMRRALVALDHDQIGRAELLQQLRKRWLGVPSQLMHERPPVG